MDEKIHEISIEEIKVSPFQPRIQFPEEELKELSDSIKEVGLIQPPVVRKIEQEGQFLYYELVCGERRWRAAKLAGLEKLSVVIRDLTDREAASLSLIENLQRVDLNPLEVAHSLKKLLEVFQMTQEELAEKVGKKRSTVTNYLRLLALPQDIQEGINSKAITQGHAKAILSLESPELKTMLYDRIVKENMSVREAEKESQRMIRESSKEDDRDQQEASYLHSYLEHYLGSKVDLLFSRDKKSGRIVVHFYSLEDLERLLELMNIRVPEQN